MLLTKNAIARRSHQPQARPESTYALQQNCHQPWVRTSGLVRCHAYPQTYPLAGSVSIFTVSGIIAKASDHTTSAGALEDAARQQARPNKGGLCDLPKHIAEQHAWGGAAGEFDLESRLNSTGPHRRSLTHPRACTCAPFTILKPV